jgi:hypothetical protein
MWDTKNRETKAQPRGIIGASTKGVGQVTLHLRCPTFEVNTPRHRVSHQSHWAQIRSLILLSVDLLPFGKVQRKRHTVDAAPITNPIPEYDSTS